MKPFKVKPLLEIATFEGRLGGIVAADVCPEVKTDPIDERHREIMRSLTGQIDADFSHLGLSASLATIKRLRKLADKPEATYYDAQVLYTEFVGRFLDEMKGETLLAVEAGKRRFFTGPNLFGDDVARRFPTTVVDIEEAGKCLALDRHTACVFHLMRALEVGLQELGAKLRVTPLTDRNWQRILDDVNGATKRLPRTTREEKAYLAQCAEAALQLQHVKDAWRNDVMHPRDVYTEEQAQDVFDTTKRLMKSLAAFV